MSAITHKIRTFARISVRSPVQAAEFVVTRLRQRPPGTYLGDQRVLITTREGDRLIVDGRDLPVSPSLILDGSFDQGFTFFLRRTLRAGDSYVDVGANIGCYVVTAAKAVGPTGSVVAYEPAPRMQEFLRNNILINSVQNRVTVRPVAVAATPGRAILGVPDNFSAAAGIGVTNLDDARDGTTVVNIDVPVVCLDDDLAGRGPIRLLKVDVEGGEGAVLEGMSTLLAERRVQTLVVEVNQVASERIGNRDGWDTMVTELRALDRAGYIWSTLDRLGGTHAITLDQALEMRFLAHLVGDAPA